MSAPLAKPSELQVSRPAAREDISVEPLPGWDAVPSDTWNALVSPGHGALRHGCLSAWRRACLTGMRPRPVVAWASDGERILAAAPACFYDLDLTTVNGNLFPNAVQALRRAAPRLMMMPVFEIGCSTPLTPPFLHHPSLDRRAAVELLLRAAMGEADRDGAQLVIVQDFVSTSGPTADALRSLGFASVPTLPTVVVRLRYGSFEDYLQAMRAPYRRRARRVLAQSAGLHAERVRDFAPLARELARLWRHVFDRAREIKREVLPEAYFRAFAPLERSSVLLLRRDDGSIASFALLLDDRPWLHFLYCGFEERAGRDEGAYFRLLYEIVRAGIEGGFEQVNLGITTVTPKLDVGGVPVALFAWFHHRSRLIQRAFDLVGARRFAPPAVGPRRVFRSD